MSLNRFTDRLRGIVRWLAVAAAETAIALWGAAVAWRRAQRAARTAESAPEPERKHGRPALVVAPAPEPEPEPEPELEPAATAKLDLGPAAKREERVEQVPWSYGADRLTAAAVDPDTLYVYWEVTDPAMEQARAALGPGGPTAWLNLRVYDTSGLIFDGTNAHSYFDHGVDRSTRQWFFKIDKPSSTAFVEIGMKSPEGFFVKIARSGRIDFPRKEPAPWSDPEWMTVLAATGETRHEAAAPSRSPAAPREPAHAEGPDVGFTPIPLWVLREDAAARAVRARALGDGGTRVEWREITGDGWSGLEGRLEWEEPALVTSWEAGPFAYPVRIEPPVREKWEGRAFAYRDGELIRVVYGPWQVVIRNLGATSSRAVMGRWQVYRSWVAHAGREARPAPGLAPASRGGASELLAGASERLWIAGSELRLGGASELWRVGASELRLRGASERLYAGASEWLLRGASERMLAGASELRLGGASEMRIAGASERRLGGASELRFEGGSASPLPDAFAEGAYPGSAE